MTIYGETIVELVAALDTETVLAIKADLEAKQQLSNPGYRKIILLKMHMIVSDELERLKAARGDDREERQP